MEFMKNMNNKLPELGGTSKHDNSIKEMYSCGRDTKKTVIANILGTIAIISLIVFITYKIINYQSPLKLTEFALNQDISKMFITLLLLSNIKTLSNSFVANIILPIMKPILPFLSSSLRIKIGLFSINVGDFISDLIVFTANIYAIYGTYLILT